ncbi:SDR family NAD(P)-dependent oxidoreductase [Acidomonas methanolica]|uniref:SDR family NAD(P)-dependent oxidoreductase n=1 Tax=Acidomonas methanolica TaxID=437 RepID=UPI00211A70CE|nr:SDR family NAD(P)-dependent oxidoreductase [Acidomonas methanolica]MCQ9155094.1 SDR family NAD(P)-dependent oxidoreductase [Acidomonas methanolica]
MSRRSRISPAFPATLRPLTGVLITGASGGIGRALARLCARPGVTLFLWGRHEGRLEETAALCRARGAVAHIRALDLADGRAALAALREDDARAPVDLLLLGAGLPDIRSPEALTEDPDVVLAMAQVNFATPVAMATEAARLMAARGRGAIAAIGSVAAFHDLPQATAYAGGKAGLARFMTALHAALAPHGVRVTVVSPGYIDTAMSRRLDGARPFLMTPEAAAARILAALGRNAPHVVFPRAFLLLKWLDALLPRCIVHRLMRRAVVRQSPA